MYITEINGARRLCIDGMTRFLSFAVLTNLDVLGGIGI